MHWRRAGWPVAATLVIFHAWMLHRYVVNFPFQDDFTQFLTVPGDLDARHTLGAKVAYVFSSSGDHRIVTLRLAALFQAKVLGDLNFRTLVFCGNLLCATTGLLVLSAAKAAFRPWLAAMAAMLLFSPSNWLPQYWASASLQHYSMLAYAFGAIFCVSRTSIAWQTAGLLLGLGAAITGANGLMVLPIGAALLYTLGRRHASALWIALSVVTFAFYFVDYQAPPGRPPPLESLRHPLSLLIMWLGTLGSIGEHFGYAVAIGAMLVAVWVWLVGSSRNRPISVLLVAWMSFLFLCVATIAFGRAPFGYDAMLNSRYRIYSELAIIITVIAMLGRIRSPQGKHLLMILLPVTAVWFWQSWESNLPFIAELITQQRSSLTHYQLTGQGIYRGFPPQDVADNLLKRADSDGYFTVSTSAPMTVLFRRDALSQTGAQSLWSEAPIVDPETITVRGFRHASDAHLLLWLEGDSRLYQGALQTQQVFNPVGTNWTIFWNTLSLYGVPPGRYKAGYSTDDAYPPVITWRDGWSEIR
jgi:hypothetical protein